MITRPFHRYYGGKFRIRKKYPPPIHDTIIEPFAGFAGYSTIYCDKNILLFDIDENICQVWNWLIKVPKSTFLRLPTGWWYLSTAAKKVNEEEKLYLSFICNSGSPSPKYEMTEFASNFWTEKTKHQLANQLQYIRHWKIENKSYHDIENYQATWFIDPPYNNKAGSRYVHSKINYTHLAEWCKERNGQITVCENEGADWLPFNFLTDTQGAATQRKLSKEVIFTMRRFQQNEVDCLHCGFINYLTTTSVGKVICIRCKGEIVLWACCPYCGHADTLYGFDCLGCDPGDVQCSTCQTNFNPMTTDQNRAWRFIVGYENLYSVSSDGMVYCWEKKRQVFCTGIGGTDRLQICLYRGEHHKFYFLDDLVKESFHDVDESLLSWPRNER